MHSHQFYKVAMGPEAISLYICCSSMFGQTCNHSYLHVSSQTRLCTDLRLKTKVHGTEDKRQANTFDSRYHASCELSLVDGDSLETDCRGQTLISP